MRKLFLALLLVLLNTSFSFSADLKDFVGVWRVKSLVNTKITPPGGMEYSWGKTIMDADNLVVDLKENSLSTSMITSMGIIHDRAVKYEIRGNTLVVYIDYNDHLNEKPQRALLILHLKKQNEATIELYNGYLYVGNTVDGKGGTEEDPMVRIFKP